MRRAWNVQVQVPGERYKRLYEAIPIRSAEGACAVVQAQIEGELGLIKMTLTAHPAPPVR